MDRECPECGTTLTDIDLQEGPEYPEYGWVYLQCPDCDTVLPAPEGASRKAMTEKLAFLPSDPNWKKNPADYHNQIDFKAAFRHIIASHEESPVPYETVIDRAVDWFEITELEADNILYDLLMSGDIYEPEENQFEVV
jgi:hypothetical protein